MQPAPGNEPRATAPPNPALSAAVIGAGAVAFVVVISFLSCMTRNRGRVEPRTLPDEYLREAARWSTIAAQASNPLIALSHVSYAIACAKVASDMTSPDYLSEVMGGDFPAFLQSCVEKQNSIVRELGKREPSLAPDVRFALASGWL